MGRQQRRLRERRAEERDERADSAVAAHEPRVRKSAGPAPTGLGKGTIAAGVLVLALAIATIAYVASHQSSSQPASATLTATPMATVAANSHFRPVGGVGCLGQEALVYHKHAHIALYDQGKHVDLPALIGIPNRPVNGQLQANCYYWLHVHPTSGAQSNIIHIESPVKKIFSLGTFIDIWKATLGSTIPLDNTYLNHLSTASNITVFYNGKRWTRGYRSVPLTPYAVITLEIGKPIVPPKPYTDWGSL